MYDTLEIQCPSCKDQFKIYVPDYTTRAVPFCGAEMNVFIGTMGRFSGKCTKLRGHDGAHEGRFE